MTKIKGLLFGLIAVLLMSLAACDTATAPGNVELDTQAPKNPFWDSCPKYQTKFAGKARQAKNKIDYQFDDQGRSSYAVLNLNKNRANGPRKACQTKTGNLFKKAGTDSRQRDYQGGHLIGSQLGGWGGRVNLAPQAKGLNQQGGNWAKIENRAALCEKRDGIQMSVRLSYPTNNTVIPQSWEVKFIKELGNDVVAIFDNKGDGGPGADGKREDVIDWLKDNGC